MTTVTVHAGRRAGEREITAREISLTMRRPERVIRQRSGKVICERQGCAVVTDEKRRTVITVYRIN